MKSIEKLYTELHILLESINPENTGVLSFIAIAIVLTLSVFLFDITTNTIRNLYKARAILKRDLPKLNQFQEQLGILSSHASLYANSLGADGAKLLNELGSIVSQQSEMLEFLQICVDQRYIQELKLHFNKTQKDQLTDLEWSEHASRIIELLGKRLYDISERSTNIGLPKAYRKESTIESLVRSKIIK